MFSCNLIGSKNPLGIIDLIDHLKSFKLKEAAIHTPHLDLQWNIAVLYGCASCNPNVQSNTAVSFKHHETADRRILEKLSSPMLNPGYLTKRRGPNVNVISRKSNGFFPQRDTVIVWFQIHTVLSALPGDRIHVAPKPLFITVWHSVQGGIVLA